jgi:hypothetical protein
MNEWMHENAAMLSYLYIARLFFHFNPANLHYIALRQGTAQLPSTTGLKYPIITLITSPLKNPSINYISKQIIK